MTNHGLNLLTYYFLDEADRFVADEDADVTTSNSRFQFILTVRLISGMFQRCWHVRAVHMQAFALTQHQDHA